MHFASFTNPFKNSSEASLIYRTHPATAKLFRADGAYVRPAEDPVTLWAIDTLHTQYGVPLGTMQLELPAVFAESTGSRQRDYQGRADVVIFDDRYINNVANAMDVAFIMVEAMEPSKKFEGTDPEGWQDHFDRLKSYMAQSPSARYAILTSGTNTVIYRRDLEYPRSLEPIGDLPPYQSAQQAAQESPFKVILNKDAPDGFDTGLKPLTRDKFREVLGDTRSGCHSFLRDNEGLQPQEAVDAMVKYLFAKWYDEQATVDLAKTSGENRAYVFSVNAKTDPERLTVQVRETFRKAKEWERDTLRSKFGDSLGVRLAFNDADELEFKAHTTRQIVEKLQPWSLRRSSADVKGGVFEDFLGKTFRDDLGQYFTPTPVINLMVGILQPTMDDYIGDPACGSARMLTHALDYVRKQEYAKAVAANGGKADGINPEEPTPEFIRFRDNHLFGAEISRNVMHVARVNTLMNGAQYADLKVMDSLSPLASITGSVTAGLPDRPGYYPGGLTMVLTNPPFGKKVTNARVLEDLASRSGVTGAKGKGVVKSIPQEVAFVNRCLEFLAPGGKLAIVLPDGVLANDDAQYVRDWILRVARLKAVVSLPQETFAPYGAGVKTSVVFSEKRAAPLAAQGQLTLKENGVAYSYEEDYSVYMARIDDIGYDAAGRMSVVDDEAHEPPDVIAAVNDFAYTSSW